MMNRRNILTLLGVAAIAIAALLLGGCEEEDVGFLTSNNVSSTRVESFGREFELPLTLDVDTSNGSVSVRGVAGIQSASVRVTLRSRGQTLEEAEDRLSRIVYHAESSGGRISLRYSSSEQDGDVKRHSGVDFDVTVPIEARVQVDTSNGTIDIEGIEGTILLDTSNGAIDVYDATGSLVADTSNGRIDVVSFTGDLRLDTSNGDIRIDDFAGAVDAETSNGSIDYSGTPTSGGNRLHTSNGSITVRVPQHASIAFDATTNSGKIRSGLALVGDTEGSKWSATLNPPADLTFNLRTSNGPIRIDGIAP
jgi:DUF4097 and DUF4098 domain-containing protein YvlB